MAVRTHQVPSVQLPPRIPLVTPVRNRDASFGKDARLVNAYAELDPVTEEYWIQKRLGLKTHQNFSGTGAGVYNWKGDLYTIYGTVLYKNGAILGTVDATGGRYIFQRLLGIGWLLLQNGVAAYYTDGTSLFELQTFSPVGAGAFVAGSTYKIVSSGNTNFVAIGAANNNPGTVFVATGPGERNTTGTAALQAGFLLVGVTYRIREVGTTNFMTIGAATNTPGLTFVATGVGTGTGTVDLPNFPTSIVKGWAYLNGHTYVMDRSCNIFGTSTLQEGGIGGLDAPQVWDPLNLIIAHSEPGVGVFLVKHLQSYILAMKDSSVEPFYDAGNPTGSPLAPVEGARSPYGCLTADSVREIDGSLLWISSNRTAAPQVVRMDELSPIVVSTPPIERLLDNIDVTKVASWVIKHAGHRFYGITLKNLNRTLVYDIDQNLWYPWTDPEGDYWPLMDTTFLAPNQTHLAQHESNGKLYQVDADYVFPNDDGVVFSVDIYTPNFDADTDRIKTIEAMFFNGDQVKGSYLLVRCSHDDYETWTNFRTVDLGHKRPMLTKCGSFTKRAWHMRHRSNTKLRLRSIGAQLDLGTL